MRWLARKLSTCSRMSFRIINYRNIHTKRKKDSYIFDSYSLKHSLLVSPVQCSTVLITHRLRRYGRRAAERTGEAGAHQAKANDWIVHTLNNNNINIKNKQISCCFIIIDTNTAYNTTGWRLFHWYTAVCSPSDSKAEWRLRAVECCWEGIWALQVLCSCRCWQRRDSLCIVVVVDVNTGIS